MISIALPLKLESEANVRCHWRVRWRRGREQKNAVALALHGHDPYEVRLPAMVTIRRVGKRKLDSDNLVISAKAVRDSVADWLGVDDGSDEVTWRYEQIVTNDYWTEIDIAW